MRVMIQSLIVLSNWRVDVLFWKPSTSSSLHQRALSPSGHLDEHSLPLLSVSLGTHRSCKAALWVESLPAAAAVPHWTPSTRCFYRSTKPVLSSSASLLQRQKTSQNFQVQSNAHAVRNAPPKSTSETCLQLGKLQNAIAANNLVPTVVQKNTLFS